MGERVYFVINKFFTTNNIRVCALYHRKQEWAKNKSKWELSEERRTQPLLLSSKASTEVLMEEKEDKVLSESTESHSNWSSQSPWEWRFTSQFSSLELTDSKILASELELKAVVQWPRSWLWEWQLLKESLVTIKSTRMSNPRERLKTCLFNMIRVSTFRTPEDASQRSSEVQVLELDSKNLTDELESSSCNSISGLSCLSLLNKLSFDVLFKAVNQFAIARRCRYQAYNW